MKFYLIIKNNKVERVVKHLGLLTSLVNADKNCDTDELELDLIDVDEEDFDTRTYVTKKGRKVKISDIIEMSNETK